jgi:hypothetical protein
MKIKTHKNTQCHNLRVQLVPFLFLSHAAPPQLNNILNNIKCSCAVIIRVRGQTFIRETDFIAIRLRGTTEEEWEAISRDQIHAWITRIVKQE